MKRKTIKFDLLDKNIPIDYQTVIDEVIGNNLSRLSCYDENWDMKNSLRGFEGLNRDRAYFIPDCDYEVIIRPKKKK